MDLMYLLELGINGAMSGLMYSLVAMGIVLIYKSSSVPNLAQGALTMVGAYVVLAFANGAGLPMWAAIPLAMLTMMGMGMGIERVALRRLAGRPIVMILMMTLGLDIFLRAVTLVIGGGTARPLDIGISNDPLFLGPLLLNRAYVVGAVVALGLFTVFVFFFRTRRGVVLRRLMRWIYSLGVRGYSFLIRLASLWNPKAKRWMQGRKMVWEHLDNWQRTEKPLYWFHCASLGEFEQGRPLIEALKNQGECQIVVTFFSPSGYEIRKNYALADLVTYLPRETNKNVARFLTKIKPDQVFFVKYEFWATYIFEAKKQGSHAD